MKINNSKDAAVASGKWAKPDASFYNRLLEEDNYLSLIHEAFLMSGDVNKDTHYSSSGCKYPHHTIRKGELVVSAPGVRAAYARAKQMGVYHGKVKEHLDKHLKEIGIFDEERHMEENFAFIESVLGIDKVIEEKSHGTLKNDFRYVYDANTGHKLKVVYSLDDIKIDYAGHAYNPEDIITKKLTDNVSAINNVEKHITKTGNIDHQSHGQKVLAIIDTVTGNKLKEANTISFLASGAPSDRNLGSNSLTQQELQQRLSSNNSNRTTLKVGEIDNTPSFKSTLLFKSKDVNKMGNAEISMKKGRGVKAQDFDNSIVLPDSMLDTYKNPSKSDKHKALYSLCKEVMNQYIVKYGPNEAGQAFASFVKDWNKGVYSDNQVWKYTDGMKITVGQVNSIIHDAIKSKNLVKASAASNAKSLIENVDWYGMNINEEMDDTMFAKSIGRDIVKDIEYIKETLNPVDHLWSLYPDELASIHIGQDTLKFLNELECESVQSDSDEYMMYLKHPNVNGKRYGLSMISKCADDLRILAEKTDNFTDRSYTLMNIEYPLTYFENNRVVDSECLFTTVSEHTTLELPHQCDPVVIFNESSMIDDYNKDHLIEKKWFITSSDGVDNCCIKVKGYDKPMRGRSSMISIRNNKGEWEVMCKKHSDGDYGVPGCGWNKHEDPKDAAIRELNEETLTTVKDVKRMHTLIEYHEEVQQWVKDHVPEKDWWYGYYSAVFVGVYNGKFTGHVNAEDRESGYTWKPLTELDKFPPEYIEAINMYISQNFDESVDQSSITPGFHTKPVNDYTVVDFVSLTDDDYNKYPILKNITKYGYGEVIFIDDKIAGYVVVRKDHTIGPMIVDKEFRGYGLSEILLRDAINKFEGKSLGVYADNEVAIRLYQKFGFKTVETKMVNGDKAYMMELESVDADLAWIEEFVNNEGFRDDIFITEDVEINSPLDLLSWMKDIQYGWITRGGKVHNGSENIANDFYNNWHLQSPTQLASTKVGVCWDDVELERQWFEMNHYKYAIFYIILNDGRVYPTHTFLVYQMGRHHYWFEYSWEKYRGIHKYHSSDVLIKDVIMRHRQEYNDYDSSVSIHWLQEVPKYGCTVQQYMRYASKQPELDYENLPSKLFKEAAESMDEELLESTLALFMEETDEEEPPEMPAEDTSGENEESTEEPETDDNSEPAQSEEEPPALTNEEETTLEEIKPKSLPKQTDENEKDKNGVNRKKLYIAFIEWCKEYNNKNTFGSVFDKDAFKVTYPFVPDEMRYFYRLANPMLCVLAGNLTFFPLADLRKINAKNTELETYMIFAATPSNDLRVFCTTDKKIYKANYEDNKIKLVNELGGTFDTYIQNMINKGDILNGSEEAM